jgi:hypothetical protein
LGSGPNISAAKGRISSLPAQAGERDGHQQQLQQRSQVIRCSDAGSRDEVGRGDVEPVGRAAGEPAALVIDHGE